MSNSFLFCLEGLALWDLDARPPVIWHFPARDLPEDSTERLNWFDCK